MPGRKIGNISVLGNIIHLELDAGVIDDHNLFDLERRTIRFTPAAGGFRVQWDTARGPALQGNVAHLSKFSFPFSGRNWDSLQVLNTGLITFGGGYNDLGFDRFVNMRTAGPKMVNTIPLISAFFKLRMNGARYANELPDRLVVTWDVSEPTAGQQDVTFARTPHHYQAVLHRDGRIDLSYQQMTARDAVVGVYTVSARGVAPTKSVDLSATKPTDAPRPVIFETFHHDGLPGSESMACTVIQALGDRFDFMVWYSDFRVDERASAFAYKGRNDDLATIGRTLGVTTVLQGSVRRAGNKVRVTAQLMSTDDGFQLWSERFDRDLDDIFAIQDEIARSIAERLELTLGLKGGAARTLVVRPTDDLQAYESYLRGREAVQQRTPASMRRGLEFFEQAIARDEAYARAHLGIAEAYIGLGVYQAIPPAEGRERAAAAIARAAALNPDLAAIPLSARNSSCTCALIGPRLPKISPSRCGATRTTRSRSLHGVSERPSRRSRGTVTMVGTSRGVRPALSVRARYCRHEPLLYGRLR